MSDGREEISGLLQEPEGVEGDNLPDLEDDGNDDVDSSSEGETIRETVARQLELLKTENSEDEAKGQSKDAPANQKNKTARTVVKQPVADSDAPAPPPSRFNAIEKELYSKLPPDLQKGVSKVVKSLESMAFKATNESRSAQKEAAHIVEVVRPYLLSRPELQAEGFTEAKLVSSLLAAHQRLTNPKTAKQAWAELGAQIGISQESLSDILAEHGAQPQAPDITQHPQFIALQNKLNEVSSYIGGVKTHQEQVAINSAVSEIDAVRNEKDQYGRFIRPELHDEAFLERTKPLVSALAKAFPEVGPGELVKRAHETLTGGNSSQLNQPRLTTQVPTRAPAAAANVSVRGRSAPSVVGQSDDIPAEALKDARAATMWAMRQLRRG